MGLRGAVASTAARDRITKRNLYARSAIDHYWIVDVDARTLEVFVRHDNHWLLLGTYGDGAVSRLPPFEAIELDVGCLVLPKSE